MLLTNGKKRIPIGYEDVKQLIDSGFYYVEADGTGATFLVTGFGPDKIHREGLGIIVTPVFFSGRQPGRSGLGFVIAATATVMLHFAYSSWIAELGLSVVDSEDSGAVTFTVFAVHETVISIRPQQVP